MKSKKKYAYGTQGKSIRDMFLETPDEANAQIDINNAKANLNAVSNPLALGVEMGGGLIADIIASNPQMFQTQGSGEEESAAYGKSINAEGGEVLDSPTTGAVDIDGPGHKDGGVDVKLPGNSNQVDIFSAKVADAKGNLVAEKKKKREKKMKSIVEMLESDPTDRAKRNAYKRKLSQLEAEEQKDLELQSQASMLASLMGLPHANSPEKKAAYGFDPDMLSRLSTMLSSDDELESEGLMADNSGLEDEHIANMGEKGLDKQGKTLKKSPFEDLNVNGTIGDALKIGGNIYGAVKGAQNVEEARAGDRTHPNYSSKVGDDAIDTLEDSMADLDAMEDNQKANIRRKVAGNKRRGRKTSRGINTMRATDSVSEMQGMMAENDVFSKVAAQKMGIKGKKAGVQMTASQAKAKGAYMARDNNDKDRHVYHSARGASLQNISKQIQETGKNLNEMKLNAEQLQLLESLSSLFSYKDGKLIAKTQ